jgi:hypothetical protein
VTVKATWTTTTIKQQSTKRGSEKNGGGGDGDGDSDNNSEGDSGLRQWWQQHGNGGNGNGNGHGGDGCRFLGIANLVEIRVRKVNHQIEKVFRCTYNSLDGIIFQRISDGDGEDDYNSKWDSGLRRR